MIDDIVVYENDEFVICIKTETVLLNDDGSYTPSEIEIIHTSNVLKDNDRVTLQYYYKKDKITYKCVSTFYRW